MDELKERYITVILTGGVLLTFVILGLLFSALSKSDRDDNKEKGVPQTVYELSNSENPVAFLETSMGEIVIELYADRSPLTVGNFIQLAAEGFYDGTKFHRVIDNFMIQGGDPNTKGGNTDIYGHGGPGYTIADEFVPGLSNLRGTIAMANTGLPNSGGSQFFINYANNVGLDFDKEPLTSKHPVFGRVVSGIDVVDAIVKVPTGNRDLPLSPIILQRVRIENVRDAEDFSPEKVLQEFKENSKGSSGDSSASPSENQN